MQAGRAAHRCLDHLLPLNDNAAVDIGAEWREA
jgi:hypothetical protein